MWPPVFGSERFGGVSVEAMGCGSSATVFKDEGAGKPMAVNNVAVTPTATKRKVRTTQVTDLDLELTSDSRPAKPKPKRTTAVVDWKPEIIQADKATPL